MNNHSRKTYTIINLPALISNYNLIAQLALHSKTIAVVKANAYGHGAIEVAKYLSKHVPILAVALIDEAIELRNAGINLPILIMEGPFSRDDFSIALEQNFWLMLHTAQQIEWLTAFTPSYNGKLWLKVDTGMNRLGIKPDQIEDVLTKFTEKQLKDLVLCTHFSSSDEINNPKTSLQIQEFDSINQTFGFKKSLANSAGILHWPESHGDYNRLGLAMYGSSPLSIDHLPIDNLPIKLTPVMTLQSTIIGLRKLAIGETVGYGEKWRAKRSSIIATIAIGYADGYPRNAKNGTPVFIKGQIAPLAGRVSMDMITVDVTDISGVELGEKVELWGENLAIETVAEYLDTVNYELLTRVSNRVTRIYVE